MSNHEKKKGETTELFFDLTMGDDNSLLTLLEEIEQNEQKSQHEVIDTQNVTTEKAQVIVDFSTVNEDIANELEKNANSELVISSDTADSITKKPVVQNDIETVELAKEIEHNVANKSDTTSALHQTGTFLFLGDDVQSDLASLDNTADIAVVTNEVFTEQDEIETAPPVNQSTHQAAAEQPDFHFINFDEVETENVIPKDVNTAMGYKVEETVNKVENTMHSDLEFLNILENESNTVVQNMVVSPDSEEVATDEPVSIDELLATVSQLGEVYQQNNVEEAQTTTGDDNIGETQENQESEMLEDAPTVVVTSEEETVSSQNVVEEDATGIDELLKKLDIISGKEFFSTLKTNQNTALEQENSIKTAESIGDTKEPGIAITTELTTPNEEETIKTTQPMIAKEMNTFSTTGYTEVEDDANSLKTTDIPPIVFETKQTETAPQKQIPETNIYEDILNNITVVTAQNNEKELEQPIVVTETEQNDTKVDNETDMNNDASGVVITETNENNTQFMEQTILEKEERPVESNILVDDKVQTEEHQKITHHTMSNTNLTDNQGKLDRVETLVSIPGLPVKDNLQSDNFKNSANEHNDYVNTDDVNIDDSSQQQEDVQSTEYKHNDVLNTKFIIKAIIAFIIYASIFFVDITAEFIWMPVISFFYYILPFHAWFTELSQGSQEMLSLYQSMFINNFIYLVLFLIIVPMFWDEFKKGFKKLLKKLWLIFFVPISYIAMIFSSVFITIIVSIFVTLPDTSINQESINAQMAVSPWGNAFSTVIGAPFVEEVIYRIIIAGGVYLLLSTLFGKTQLNKGKKILFSAIAIVLSTAFFGFIHVTSGDYLAIFPYLVSGATLGILYFATDRNIVMPLLLHIFNNLVSFLVTMLIFFV